VGIGLLRDPGRKLNSTKKVKGGCTTAQHIYCTNTAQTVQSETELYLRYTNYTEAAATFSAAQQHCTFTVQILHKLYILKLSCTYSNYTEAAANIQL